MATPLVDSIAHVTAALEAVGVTATPDARDLNLPGAWVTVSSLHYDRVGTDTDAGGVDLEVLLIAPDAGLVQAIALLDDLATKATDALGITTWEAATIILRNHSAEPLPVLTGSLHLEWSK